LWCKEAKKSLKKEKHLKYIGKDAAGGKKKHVSD